MKNVMEMSLDSLSKKKQLDPKQEIAIEEKPSDELLIQRM